MTDSVYEISGALTVRDLIEELQQLDPTLPVFIHRWNADRERNEAWPVDEFDEADIAFNSKTGCHRPVYCEWDSDLREFVDEKCKDGEAKIRGVLIR